MAWCSLPSLMVCSHVPSTNQPGLGQRQDTCLCTGSDHSHPALCHHPTGLWWRSKVLPTVPCPPMSSVLSQGWSQASGMGPRRAGAVEDLVPRAPFLSSSQTEGHEADFSPSSQSPMLLGWIVLSKVVQPGAHPRVSVGQEWLWVRYLGQLWLLSGSSNLLVKGELPKVRNTW